MKFLRMLVQGLKDVDFLVAKLEKYLLCWLDAATAFPWIEIYMITIWTLFALTAFWLYIPVLFKK